MGEKGKKELVKHFGCVKKMKEGRMEEFEEGGMGKERVDGLIEGSKK
ncbi:hypothetical protein [Bacillus pumilus]|nr:hypothetical protein [Bacillus pumilus]